MGYERLWFIEINHSFVSYLRDISSQNLPDIKSEIPSYGNSNHSMHHGYSRRRLYQHSQQYERLLNTVHPSATLDVSFEISLQPETQHRARYLTEGSRGPVKDASQQAYPQLQVRF